MDHGFLSLSPHEHFSISTAISRLFVCSAQVYDIFVARVTELASKLRQGPVLGSQTVDCGAMVMPAQLDIVQASKAVADTFTTETPTAFVFLFFVLVRFGRASNMHRPARVIYYAPGASRCCGVRHSFTPNGALAPDVGYRVVKPRPPNDCRIPQANGNLKYSLMNSRIGCGSFRRLSQETQKKPLTVPSRQVIASGATIGMLSGVHTDCHRTPHPPLFNAMCDCDESSVC